MPAVTADTLTLPKIVEPPAETTRPRPVRSVTTAPSGFEGEGFPVRRTMAGISLADLDPFIMMDQMGEVDYPPYEAKGTPWHPHRGFETVTYVIDGTFLHQDSHGGGGVITDGGTQWMTAGGGILHIETPPEDLVVRGGLFHGFQLWVNLPSRAKMIPPAYQNLEAGLVTLATTPDAGVLVRIIAGDIGGHRGPGATQTPVTVAHVTLEPGARAVLPWDQRFNALAYAMKGAGFVGAERRPIELGQMALFGEGGSLVLEASGSQALDLVLLGGEPIGEPVAHYGPFVMNSRAELVQAMEDFQSGKMGTVPADGIQPFHG